MNKEQNWVIEHSYCRPLVLSELFQELGVDGDDFYSRIGEGISEYIDFDLREPFEQSVITLNARGKEYAENLQAQRQAIDDQKHKERIELIKYCITTAIALSAFIKSFFF